MDEGAGRAARASALDALPGRDALLERFRELFYLDAICAPSQPQAAATSTSRTPQGQGEGRSSTGGRARTAPEKVLLDPNAWSTDGTVSLGIWVPSWDGKKVVFAEKPNAADEATLLRARRRHRRAERRRRHRRRQVRRARRGRRTARASITSGCPPTRPSPSTSAPATPSCASTCSARTRRRTAVHPERTGDPKTFLGGGVEPRRQVPLHLRQPRLERERHLLQAAAAEATRSGRLLVKGKDATYGVDAVEGPLLRHHRRGRAAASASSRSTRRSRSARTGRRSSPRTGGRRSRASASSAASSRWRTCKDAAQPSCASRTLDGKPVREVPLPGIGRRVRLVGHEDDDEAYFVVHSFTTPQQIYKTSVKSGEDASLWAKVELPIDPTPYTVEQVFYPSKDGTRDPDVPRAPQGPEEGRRATRRSSTATAASTSA